MIARDDRELHGADRGAPSLAATILVIVAASAAVAAAIGVRGEFPLSDDWSYAYTARALCTDGEMRFLPWTGASLVLQAGYGALLCHVFGFSFTVLRVSTVVVATAGTVGFALLLRECGVRGAAAALALLVFALNPLWVNLAFTFMTDVPFTAAAVWAGVWYARGLRTGRDASLVAGGIAAAAALLIRQHGIFVAAAAAGVALLDGGRPWRDRVRAATAAAAIPVLVFVIFHVWLFALHGTPQGYQNKIGEVRHGTVLAVANAAFRAIGYLGLFLSPFAVAVARPAVRSARRTVAAVLAVLLVVAGALYLRTGALMPYLTNVLYDLGLGPLSLRDTLFLGFPPPTRAGTAFEMALTIASLAAAAILAAFTAAHARDVLARQPDRRRTAPAEDPRTARAVRFVAVAAALLLAGSLLHVRYYFDRYLLAGLPFAIATIAVAARRAGARPAPFVVALVLAWYAVAGTHDYLAWNRARFAALDALVQRGVPPTAIDGGFEFNAWHLAASLGTWPTDAEARTGQPETRRSWWWVVDDRYVATFQPLAGRHVQSETPYPRWLIPGTGRVLILERDAE